MYARGLGAMSTAKYVSIRLDPVSDHLTAAMSADRCQFVNGALEAIENMPLARRDDLKGQIILIPAHLTWLHMDSPLLHFFRDLLNGRQVLLERRQRFCGKCLNLRISAAIGLPLKRGDVLFMILDHHLDISLVKLSSG